MSDTSRAPRSRPRDTMKNLPVLPSRPIYKFIDRWLNNEKNRVVLEQGGPVFMDLIIHLQREQAGERQLTPDKLEAYYDVIELLNEISQRFQK